MPSAGGLCLILYHKHPTSARVRFARFGNTLLAAHLPTEAVAGLARHPGPLLSQVAERLGLPAGALRIDPGFSTELVAPGGTLTVRLGEFTAIDPPFAPLEALGGRFVALTELHGIAATERDAMRAIYEHILG